MGHLLSRLRAVAVLSVLCSLLVAVAVAGASPASAAAKTLKRSAPQGYVGMNISDGTLDPRFPLEKQMGDMVKAGVESVIAQVPWSSMQPMSNGPIDFAGTDRLVLNAARLGMTFVPVVVFAPPWGALTPDRQRSPPQAAAFATFLSTLVRRYGPGGELWKANPKVKPVPITTWQVWNEPTLSLFWDQDGPWQATYVAVLKAAHDAIKAADPKAKVALAGLVNFSWQDLESLYEAGAKGLFDVLSLHPYTGKIKNVLKILKKNRDVLDAHGDKKVPILMTEMGWPASEGHVQRRYGFEVTPKALVTLIGQALPAYANARKTYNIAGFYWYTWATADKSDSYAFDYAGLRTQVSPTKTRDKIGLAAFRKAALKLEGCASKGATALICRK